jgi:hypothetical protein
MAENNSIQVDGNGNIIIHEVDNSIININTNNIDDIKQKLEQLNEQLLLALKQVTDEQAEKLSKEFKEMLEKELDQKKKKKLKNLIMWALIIVIICISIFVVFYYFWQETSKNEKVIENKDSINTKLNTIVIKKKKSTNSDKDKVVIYDTVTLIVSSKMENAIIYIDGKPADIIDDLPSFKTIKVQRKKDNHHFKLYNNEDSCTFNRVVTQNNMKIKVP